jgi:hypothetical protein
VGLDGMTNVALPAPQALRYMVLILVTTKWSFSQPNRAQTYARCCSVSSFLFFYLLAYLSDLLCGQRM